MLFQRYLLELATKDYTGVVDQAGDGADFFMQLVPEFGNRGNLAHIQYIGVSLATGGLDPLRHFASRADTTGRNDDFCPLFGKFLCHQGANAGTGAGDQNTVIIKTGHVSSLLMS